MARKELTYTAQDGRDKGKKFKLTEMGAAQAERWAMRALLAFMNSGAEIPSGLDKLGMSALAEVGIKNTTIPDHISCFPGQRCGVPGN